MSEAMRPSKRWTEDGCYIWHLSPRHEQSLPPSKRPAISLLDYLEQAIEDLEWFSQKDYTHTIVEGLKDTVAMIRELHQGCSSA
jgi:hypothetical protein